MKIVILKFALLGLLSIASVTYAQHNEPDKSFEVIKVTDTLHMLKGRGGNVGVFVGEDGALIVDDNYKDMSVALDTRLKELGGDRLRFVLNTHWHGDHTGGNIVFGERAHIIAHSNVRNRLSSRQEVKEFNMVQEPQEKAALPVITFDDSLSLHFNGDTIKALHLPKGHTDGDSVVYFSNNNVVHMGDLYWQGMFPFVDTSSGGDVRSLADNIKKVLDSIKADTKVIPGHGNLSNMTELKDYHSMLVESIAIISKMKKEGLTLEQAQAKGLPKQLDRWGTGYIKAEAWIKRVYEGVK